MSDTPVKNKRPNIKPTIAGVKLRGAEKVVRIPVKIEKTATPLRKPDWIRIRLPQGKAQELKQTLRENKPHMAHGETCCPNPSERFTSGTATFMILGDICTRRYPFCDAAHGQPLGLDKQEPKHLAETICAMKLNDVVITSVDRDDLRSGGADHSVECIQETRALNPDTQIEILVPDFHGPMVRSSYRADLQAHVAEETH